MSAPATHNCRVCGAPAAYLGSKKEFHFYRCASCAFAFIGNPWTDYARIYDEAYYKGQGADPLVDYVFELDHPDQTIRLYEWRGILETVQSLRPLNSQTKWLDFGCGNGGLVRHVRAHSDCQILGFEEGWITAKAREMGIPVLSPAELDSQDGSCDIVTAIEVIEHVERPVEFLRRVNRLLKPGGLLFLTTGNAAPHRDSLLRWGYTTPEIHMSFFEPGTLAHAMRSAGFEVQYPGFRSGYTGIIRFKVLKNLGRRKRETWERCLPWNLLSRIVDAKHRVSAHPCGIKPTSA
ncbi:MAG: class I SAM-dependent methyltransferase [Acidobacteria bacterium]|nr:class I SAM-dependent methyltransferase [Acidobacteriota bacterium]